MQTRKKMIRNILQFTTQVQHCVYMSIRYSGVPMQHEGRRKKSSSIRDAVGMKSNCPASELERVDHTEKLNWESQAWNSEGLDGRGETPASSVFYCTSRCNLARKSQRPYEYLDALLATLPHESIPQDITNTCLGAGHSSSPHPKFIDTVLRLVSGGPARADEVPHLGRAWPEIQASVQRALDALHHPSSSSSSTQPST